VQTLLCNMTGNLPVWPEAHNVYDQIRSYSDARKLWNKAEFYFDTIEEMRMFYRDAACSIVHRVLARLETSRSVILKDPRFCAVTESIFSLFPDASMVCCIRDPRDVVCSFIQIRERERGRGLTRAERKNEIVRAAERYRSAYAAAGEHADAVFAVYYEDVVRRPQEIIAEVAGRCGLELNGMGTDRLAWGPVDRRHQAAWISELEGRAPSAREIGKFKKLMSADEVARVEQVCADVMGEYGYERYGPAGKWRKLRRIARAVSP